MTEAASERTPRSLLCEIGRDMRRRGRVSCFEPDAAAAGSAVSSLTIALRFDGGQSEILNGTPAAVLCLSRPAPNGGRFQTSIGFATFQRARIDSYGMFEYSRRIQPAGELSGPRD
jgi:hypothetical protein